VIRKPYRLSELGAQLEAFMQHRRGKNVAELKH